MELPFSMSYINIAAQNSGTILLKKYMDDKATIVTIISDTDTAIPTIAAWNNNRA